MLVSPILRSASDGHLIFWCPGCDMPHGIYTGQGARPRWAWNNSTEKPTFDPSIKITYPGIDAGKDGAPAAVCHFFVREGKFEFLNDCTHALAGQTVDIPDWETASNAP